jgi:hypothetical protein
LIINLVTTNTKKNKLTSSTTNTTKEKMKKTILLIGLTMATIVPTFAQGYLDFSWTAGSGIQIGSPSNPSSQQPGWYLGGDYSVQAYMAVGSVGEGSLQPIAAAKTTFLGGATTVAPSGSGGSPATDLAGLWFAGAQDTGLAIGADTIQVRVWYDPNHNSTYEAALAAGLNTGKSALLSITTVSSTDPTIKSLDSIGLQAFAVGAAVVPEPSTFALAGLGAAALLIFRRRK